MKIIDAHTHIGESRVTVGASSEQSLLKNMERYHLDGVFCLPLPDVSRFKDCT